MIATACGSHSAQREPRTPRQRAPELAGCTWTRIKLVEAMVVLIARLERRWQLSRRRTEREKGAARGGIELRPRPAAPSSRSCVLLVLDGEYLPRSQSPPIAEADRARGRRHGSNHLRSSNGLVISGCHRACMCQQHTDYCSRRRQRERNEEERDTWYCAVVAAKATRTGRQRARGDGAGYFG